MLLTALTPTESLEKAYRLQSGNREQIDRFKANYTKLLGLINERESEENVKGHCGFSFRILDHKNFYGIRYSFGEGNIAFFKVKDGVGTYFPGNLLVPVESFIKEKQKWINLKLEVNDAEIKMYVNGKLFWSITDTNPINTRGGVGVYSRGNIAIVNWDNFTVSSAGIVSINTK